MTAPSETKSAARSNRKTIAQSLVEIVGELKKVTWPSRHEVVRLTGIVLVICIIAGVIIGLFDYGFAQLVSKVLIRG
jgi:preprotein translocase SecE subunit